MDLHAWITQQVDRVEIVARRATADLGAVLNQIDYQDDTVTADEQHIMGHAPAAVLRRCEADRRILADHCLVDTGYSVACEACGTAGICQDWVTDNLNDCPMLLAIGYAHGLTDEILAGLDRSQTPELQPHAKVAHTPAGARQIARLLAIPPVTTSDVPAALRGPRWKP